jgi:MATE family multidrug resistance protein
MDVALPGILFLMLADANKRLLNSMGHQNGPMIV